MSSSAPSLLASYVAKLEDEDLEAGDSVMSGPSDGAAPADACDDPEDTSSRSIRVEDVVDFTVSARESFEVFMGRRYDPAEALLDAPAQLFVQEACAPGSAAASRFAEHLASRLGRGAAAGGGAAGSRRGASGALASPLARYARLLADVQALQSELGVVAAQDEAASGATVTDAGGGIYRILNDGAAHVRTRLEALRSPAEAADTAAARPPPSLPPHVSAELRALASASAELLARVAAAEATQKELRAAAADLAARTSNITALL